MLTYAGPSEEDPASEGKPGLFIDVEIHCAARGRVPLITSIHTRAACATPTKKPEVVLRLSVFRDQELATTSSVVRERRCF